MIDTVFMIRARGSTMAPGMPSVAAAIRRVAIRLIYSARPIWFSGRISIHFTSLHENGPKRRKTAPCRTFSLSATGTCCCFAVTLSETQYYLGRYENDKFYPETYARMSWYGGHLGGGITVLDNQGRRIFFDWIREMRGAEAQREAGWSGVMTVPRVLSLAPDGSLKIEPAPELKILRMNHRGHENIHLTDSERMLADVRGDCLELAVEIDVREAQEFGINVRCSPDGQERTGIVCIPGKNQLKVDVSQSTLDPDVKYPYYRGARGTARLPESQQTVNAQEAPFTLTPGETLRLNIFLDRSVLEVFANGRQCITQRIYPTRSDSFSVVLFSRGGSVNVRSVEAWDMAAAVE